MVAATVALVVAVGIGVVAVTRTSDDEITVPTAAARETCDPKRRSADLEVFMTVDATPTQIAEVRSALLGLDGTTIVRKLSKDESYRAFRCVFAENPDLVDSIDAADLPVSFLVRADDPSAARATMTAVAGVESIETAKQLPACPSLGEADLRVYFARRAGDARVRAAREAVEEMRGVRRVRIVGKREAYQRYRCLQDRTDDDPRLDDMPVSLLVVVDGDAGDVEEQIARLQGVDSVTET